MTKEQLIQDNLNNLENWNQLCEHIDINFRWDGYENRYCRKIHDGACYSYCKNNCELRRQ